MTRHTHTIRTLIAIILALLMLASALAYQATLESTYILSGVVFMVMFFFVYSKAVFS